MQEIIVVLIVGTSLFLAARRFVRFVNGKGGNCCSGSTKCAGCTGCALKIKAGNGLAK